MPLHGSPLCKERGKEGGQNGRGREEDGSREMGGCKKRGQRGIRGQDRGKWREIKGVGGRNGTEESREGQERDPAILHSVELMGEGSGGP